MNLEKLIQERIDWYQKEIERCERIGNYGEDLHYFAIRDELKRLLDKRRQM